MLRRVGTPKSADAPAPVTITILGFALVGVGGVRVVAIKAKAILWPKFYHLEIPGSRAVRYRAMASAQFQGSSDRTIRVWDLEEREPPCILDGHTDVGGRRGVIA